MIPAALAAAVAVAQDDTLDGAVAVIRPFMEDIGWFETLLADELEQMTRNPMHLPPLRAMRQGNARHLVLARTERIWITATAIDMGLASAGHVHFSGRVTLCRPLREPLSGQRYRIVGGRALPAAGEVWPTGRVAACDERQEAFCLSPLPRPQHFLRAQIAPPGPVHTRRFDRASGALVAAETIDERPARALMLLSLLRTQARRDAAGQFAEALDAPLADHRWAAMREYLALDTQHALPALQAMAQDDVDDRVRAIATRTLNQVASPPCPA